MTHKNRSRPALDAPVRFSILLARASLPIDLLIPAHAAHESLLPIESGRAECMQSTLANYRGTILHKKFIATFHRLFIMNGPADGPAGAEDRLIRQGSPLRRHALGAAL
jgi:hypothetical protein